MTVSGEATAVPPDVAQAHSAILARTDLQFDFAAPPRLAPPDWLAGLIKLLGTLAPYLRYALWTALGIAVLLAIYFGGRAALRRFRPRPIRTTPLPSPHEWRPAPQAARLLLLEADTLAAQGQFGEAAHLLLLRGIEDVAERRPMLVKPALTSREISALEQLPAAPRTAFACIAQVVERALFAGRVIGAEDFARCRLEYERFALPWSVESMS